MTWYAVYRVMPDGSDPLVSVGTVLAAPDVLAANGLAYVEISGQPGAFSVWNPATHTFDQMPTPKAVLSKSAFVEKFTEQEWEDLQAYPSSNLGTAANRKRVLGGLKRLEWMDEIDLNLAKIQNSIIGMETLGIIGPGRAAQIIG